MYYFGKSEENMDLSRMDLSRIYLAVLNLKLQNCYLTSHYHLAQTRLMIVGKSIEVVMRAGRAFHFFRIPLVSHQRPICLVNCHLGG